MKKTLIILFILCTVIVAGCSKTEYDIDIYADNKPPAIENAGLELTSATTEETGKSLQPIQTPNTPSSERIDKIPLPGSDGSAGTIVGVPESQPVNSDINIDYSNIDIDLSELTGNGMYLGICMIMDDAESYVGKSVKCTGKYTEYTDPETGARYHTCITEDDDGCTRGIEFIPQKSYLYPQDYPNEGDIVTVTGIVAIYSEGGTYYCTLKDAEISTGGNQS